jgi:hypothetical protein
MSTNPPTLQDTAPSLTTGEVAAALNIDTSPSPRVRICTERIALVAQHLREAAAFKTLPRATWDDRLFWNADADALNRSQYFAVGNSINFRFWSLDERGRVVPVVGTVDGVQFRGALYMWRCLKRSLDRQVPLLEADFLASVADGDFDAIFSDDTGANPLQVAQDERLANLRDLGSILLESWNGQFYNVLSASDCSIVEFARLSTDFRAFDDPLFKLTMVNAIVHSGSGVYSFSDEALPAIDYHLLRHALRQGLIEPGPKLGIKLREGDLISADEAFDLRRLALHAFVSIAEQSGLSGERLDNLYWLNRVNCAESPVCVDPATAARCPFLAACARTTSYRLPLELTRYY